MNMSCLIGNILTWVINTGPIKTSFIAVRTHLRWSVLIVIPLTVACGDSDLGVVEESSREERLTYRQSSGGNGVCARPAGVSGSPADSDLGYIVEIAAGANLYSESVRLLETYGDLELFSVSEACNCLYVNSGNDTFESIRCEQNVDKISYDFDQL